MTGLWDWAGRAANEEARRHSWGGNYTLQEREMGIERVVTGLVRSMRDDVDEDEEEDDEGEAGKHEDEIEAANARIGEPMEVVGMRSGRGGNGVEIDVVMGGEKDERRGLLPMPLSDVLRFMTTTSTTRR